MVDSFYGGRIFFQSALRDSQKAEEKDNQAIWWFTTGRHRRLLPVASRHEEWS